MPKEIERPVEGDIVEEIDVKSSRSDKCIKRLAKDRKLVCVLIGFIIFVCLFQLGSKQLHLDHCVEFSLYPAINKVLDGVEKSGEVTWKWTDMYQHAAGRSPVYTGLMELGIRSFGLTQFGVRIYIAIIYLLVFAILFYTLFKYFSSTMAVLMIFLTLLSPWGLVMLRSGGVVALGIALSLLAVCLCGLMFLPEEKQPKSKIVQYIIPIGAGICTAILPYCHAGTRMFPIAIIIFILIFIKRLGLRRALLFFVPFLAIVGIQLIDPQNAISVYFAARGETLVDTARAQSPDDIWGFVLPKLGENIMLIFKYLLGLNQKEVFFRVNLVHSYGRLDAVFFPKFLVPFFWGGIILHVIYLFKKKRPIYLIPIILFGISLIPALMSGWGAPNLARMAVGLPYIYYFIVYSFYQLFLLSDKVWNRFGVKKGSIMATVLVCVVVFTMVYQIHNYYAYEKGERDDKIFFDYAVVNQCFNLWNMDENAIIVFQDSGTFNMNSNGAFRLMGGKKLQEKVKEGKMIFFGADTKAVIDKMIKEGKVDMVITVQGEGIIELFPELANYTRLAIEPVGVYTKYIKN